MLCRIVSRGTVFRCLRLQKVSMMSSLPNKISGPLPDGVWPTMITPFLNDEKKSIDWNGLDSKYMYTKYANELYDIAISRIS